jgi:hypothetical protein
MQLQAIESVTEIETEQTSFIGYVQRIATGLSVDVTKYITLVVKLEKMSLNAEFTTKGVDGTWHGSLIWSSLSS